MCLLLLALRRHPDYPLILASNRDEFYQRPSAAARFWREYPHLLAGRDERAGGTWLGVTRDGRFAAVTNYRDGAAGDGVLSRGFLVRDFLAGENSAQEFLREVREQKTKYNGFSLLAGDGDGVFFYSNRDATDTVQKIPPGVHGLCNHLLNTPWPKLKRGVDELDSLIKEPHPQTEKIFALLHDHQPAADTDLPDTGIGTDLERKLSAVFTVGVTINGDDYGSVNSTVLLVHKTGLAQFHERAFNADGNATGDSVYSFTVEPGTA